MCYNLGIQEAETETLRLKQRLVELLAQAVSRAYFTLGLRLVVYHLVLWQSRLERSLSVSSDLSVRCYIRASVYPSNREKAHSYNQEIVDIPRLKVYHSRKREVSLMQAYCVKCRAKREMRDAKAITMKNGKPATQGVCPVCGTKMFRIGKS